MDTQELWARAERTQDNADELISLIEEVFAQIAGGGDEDGDIVREILGTGSVETAGDIIRRAAAKDAERGREVDEVYLCLVYLVATEGETRNTVMKKPVGYDELMARAVQ